MKKLLLLCLLFLFANVALANTEQLDDTDKVTEKNTAAENEKAKQQKIKDKKKKAKCKSNARSTGSRIKVRC